ncbi:MAG: hypothetical protein NTY38_08995 [Acidobacteria bacterium]|nr:hypothetical protein [Acidobacteriota bacterium]
MMTGGAFRRVAALWVAMSLLAVPAEAQALDDWRRVVDLPAGCSVAVKTKAGKWYHGDLVGATADLITLNSDERGAPGRIWRRREVRREDASEVRRPRRGVSALAGAGVGGAVGAGIGLAIDLRAKSNEDQGLVTVVFVFLGGLLGLLVGRHLTLVKGSRVYVAR